MSLRKSVKISNWETLQMEKQRMKAVCEVKEAELREKLNQLRYNYPTLIVNALSPFQSPTTQRVSSVLDWFNSNILGLFFGKNVSALPLNLIKILQVAAISLSYNFFRNLFSRRKRKREQNQDES